MDRLLAAAHGRQTRTRLIAVFSALAVLNAGAWFALFAASHQYPLLLGLGVTAYVLGLRHAVDPDHIAAIDSTTRKLMHAGRRPTAVGFFFSLGHSTIVFALGAVVVVFGSAIKTRVPAFAHLGAVVGTSVSAIFLLVVAVANVVILLDILHGQSTRDEAIAFPGGILARILRPSLAMVTQSWHMYPVGVLFGLGFDTATEVALLGISAASAAGGMPILFIMILPLLFAAGMSLVDTAEGVAMLGAYSWAYVQPRRKIAYNVNMTVFSVLVSLVIGGAEALAVLGLPFAASLSFTSVGYGVLGAFGGSLALSALVTNSRRGVSG